MKMEKKINVDELNRQVLNKIERDFDNGTEIRNCLNIAIIGKTGSGKSSFLNAFRGLSNKDDTAANEGATPKGTIFKPEEAKFDHKVTGNNGEIKINFFDTIGFFDNNNTSIEIFLSKVKDHFKIVEFDAIIFVTKDRLSNQELEIAKENAEKDVMLFFVYNQVDKFYQDYLKVNNLDDHEISLVQQVKQNEKSLKDALKNNRKLIYDLIKEHGVFNNLMSETEKFTSLDLNCDSYKTEIIKESTYLITSNKKYFENELISNDGKRLKSEIENHLILSKFYNFNIDLLDPFSKRTIYLKKKIILKNLFDGKKLKIAGAAFSSIIPFLDYWQTKSINKTYKNEFFEKFGMKKLRDRINENPSSVSKNPSKIAKIKKIFEKIDSDESIKSLDKIFDGSNISNSENVKERIQHLINNILPTIGLTAAGLTDDFIGKIGGIAVAFSKSSLVTISLISFPISISIYVFLLRKGVEKILIKYEEYALLLLKALND